MLPLNQAIQSAILLETVLLTSTSSLTLRETRVRSSSSALRVMRLMAASMWSAESGRFWKSSSKSSRSRTSSSASVSAMAVAVRGPLVEERHLAEHLAGARHRRGRSSGRRCP